MQVLLSRDKGDQIRMRSNDGMTDEDVMVIFSALSQETRLRVFKVLVAHHQEGLRPSDLASLLSICKNTLSFHLSLLTQAGLVSQERRGKEIFYRSQCHVIRQAANFLMQKGVDGNCDCLVTLR
jgi:ArsR family transcriptional regulator